MGNGYDLVVLRKNVHVDMRTFLVALAMLNAKPRENQIGVEMQGMPT